MPTAEDIWRQKTDEEVFAAAQQLDDYTEDGQQIIARAPDARFETFVETHLSHPTDSHPTLAARLSSLGVDLASIAAAAGSVEPEDPAASVLPGFDRWETELTDAYEYRLATQLGIQRRPARVRGWSPIRTCSHCGTKVLPTRDRRCPSCGHSF